MFSVGGYWVCCAASGEGGLNGFKGVIIISFSPFKTPCSLPGCSTS